MAHFNARQFLYTRVTLLRLLWVNYAEFATHPEYRGEKFTWIVPGRIAYQQWRCYFEQGR